MPPRKKRWTRPFKCSMCMPTLPKTSSAMPVVKGEKTRDERFPGAVSTYTIEAMMQGQEGALQAGTSHFLDKTSPRRSPSRISARRAREEFAWTTSWGVSTRLVGALIMTHSDDDGLVVPPRLAPTHVLLLPIYRDDADRERVLEYCESIRKDLRSQTYGGHPIEARVDDRDLRGGEKAWQAIKQGVPIRLEVGPRDLEADSVFMGRRDRGPREKESMGRGGTFLGSVVEILDDMQQGLYQKAKTFLEENIIELDDVQSFKKHFRKKGNRGFVLAFAHDTDSYAPLLKDLKVTARCMPLAHKEKRGTCIFTGEETPLSPFSVKRTSVGRGFFRGKSPFVRGDPAPFQLGL